MHLINKLVYGKMVWTQGYQLCVWRDCPGEGTVVLRKTVVQLVTDVLTTWAVAISDSPNVSHQQVFLKTTLTRMITRNT